MSIIRILRTLVAVTVVATFASSVFAQDGKPPDALKPKAAPEKVAAEKAVDPDAGRYCASVAPSIAEARIAWQTKRLAEFDGQVRQRIADLEKAEASARDWIAKRDALMKSAQDDVVAIYSKMEPESAARQISALDDRTAAAILGKLKPSAAGAILGEMDADRASRLAGLIAGVNPEEKRS
ncbi:MotE family protein [Roseiarcus sp.]|uniref:MotE family protein n=1 Tax=Roseiarcus sp. TaxID=1969460 RepID=UPI003F995A46